MVLRFHHHAGAAARSGFTLLELILTTAIAVLLLAALYVAFDIQIGNAQAGRNKVERTTLARALHNRLRSDISATLALCDSSRYRKANPDGPPVEGDTAAEEGQETTEEAEVSGDEAVELGTAVVPIGIQGDAQQLIMYTSKLPRELFRVKPDELPPLVSDQRRISYWLVEGEQGGLARLEETLLNTTSLQQMGSIAEEQQHILAPEVRELSFRYFNGTEWVESWDSEAPGEDGVTPVGPPRAIEVILGLVRPSPDPEQAIQRYRSIIAIPTADGLPLVSLEGGIMP
jgi:prepilin-type N-terminal cleavage/methylation domain-containing protein